MLHKHFPEPVDATVPVPAMQGCSLEENFHRAIQLFIKQTLNEKKPRDRQYIYLQPGGDYVFQKLMMQVPIDHLQQFKEMIVQQKLSKRETCNHPTRCYNLSGFICPSTPRISQSTSRVGNVLATRCLSQSQSTLRTFSTLR